MSSETANEALLRGARALAEEYDFDGNDIILQLCDAFDQCIDERAYYKDRFEKLATTQIKLTTRLVRMIQTDAEILAKTD